MLKALAMDLRVRNARTSARSLLEIWKVLKIPIAHCGYSMITSMLSLQSFEAEYNSILLIRSKNEMST